MILEFGTLYLNFGSDMLWVLGEREAKEVKDCLFPKSKSCFLFLLSNNKIHFSISFLFGSF